MDKWDCENLLGEEWAIEWGSRGIWAAAIFVIYICASVVIASGVGQDAFITAVQIQ